MDERFSDRQMRREKSMRTVSVLLAGLLVLLVGFTIFLILAFGQRPADVAAIDESPSPSLMVTAMPTNPVVPSIDVPTPTVATTPSFETAAPPTATLTAPPTEPPAKPTEAPTAVPTATPVSSTPAVPTATLRPPLAGDHVADAIVIGSIPFSHSMRTRRATTSRSDPECDYLPRNSSVWFRYLSPASQTLGATTVGSDYDTTLIVATETGPGDLLIIGCNDDVDGVSSSLRFDAQAGTTYLFMVGSYGREGGNLVFSLDTAPPPGSITVTVDPTGTFDARGLVTLTGTIRCTRGVERTWMEIELRQIVDRNVLTGYQYLDVENCSRQARSWTALISSDQITFGEEPATVTVDVYGHDGYVHISARTSSPVTLVSSEPPPPSPSPAA